MHSMEGRDRRRRLAKCSLMAVLSCLLLLSCDKGEVVDAWDETTGKVCFGVSYDDDEATTRGTPITSANFYGTFHVLAYRTTGSTLANEFFMDDDVTKGSGTTWSSSRTYYWPGVEHTLKFYAWAPADAFTSQPTNSSSTSLGYAVPDAATSQQDLMVAVTSDISGDRNSAVPLQFEHICTAVSVKVGSQMQEGTIKSITLQGVQYKGTYDMASGAWSLDDSTKDFSQDVNLPTTTTTASGTAVTPTEGTFMMLPQTLPAAAKIVVAFEASSGTTRTLEASIAGGVWQKGVPMVYNLSITSGMSIEVPTTSQDAHYISFPVTVKMNGYTGNWTLTSNMTSDVFFTKTRTTLQEQGYWIDESKGDATVTDTGDATYYVYVTENVSDAARDIKFTLTPASGTSTGSAVTATVTQLCPSWNSSGVGYERIEENTAGYAFGFSWDRVATFSYSGLYSAASGLNTLAEGLKTTDNSGYYSVTLSGSLFNGSITAVVDYNDAFSLGKSSTDGLANTKELFNSNTTGFNDASTLETAVGNIVYDGFLGNYNFTLSASGGDFTTPDNYAVRMAVMKNKFTLDSEGNPTIAESDIKWYLPASDEQSGLSDTDYPLSGDYWSSTTTTGNSTFSYNGTTTSATARTATCKIRAARKR